MTQHVPGSAIPELPLDEQADILGQKLTGHQIFARMRGKVAGYPMWELLDPSSQTSPSHSLKEFDEFVGGVRVMRNLIVWLRWHGCRRAAKEVLHALANEEYRLWCEEVSFDASVSGVLLMFEPGEVLPLAQWWARETTSSEIFRARMDALRDERGQEHVPTDLSADTRQYLEKFPGLLKLRDHTESLFTWLRKEVVNPILRQTTESTQEMFNRRDMSFCGRYYPLYTGEVNKVNERDGYDCGAFAYFFPQTEQDEALGWFPREAQKRLATWQLRVPERSLRGTVELFIGLYPESEHALWQKLYPSLTSKGVSVGLGALFSPRDEFAVGKGRLTLRSR